MTYGGDWQSPSPQPGGQPPAEPTGPMVPPGQPQPGQPQPGQPPYGAQPPYGRPQYGQPPSSSPPYGQPSSSPPYGQPSSAPPYGQPSSAPPYGQPSSAPPYGQPAPTQPFTQPPSSAPYGQQFGQPGPYGQPAPGMPGQGPLPYGVLPPIPPPPKRRTGLLVGLIAGAVVLILVVCGLGGFFLLRGDDDPDPVGQPTGSTSGSSSPSESASPTPNPSPTKQVDISARATDPEPLTTTEVYPDPTISAVGQGPYTIIKRDAQTRCSAAAFGKTASLLTQNGCNQVVRATVLDSTKRYVATAGVANMPDEASAERVYQVLRTSSDRVTGFFSPLAAPGAGGYSAQQALVFISQVVGHYIVYYIAGRADGKDMTTTDPQTRNFSISLLPHHQQVLLAREG